MGREARQAVWRARAGGGVKVMGGRSESSSAAAGGADLVTVAGERPQKGL